MTTESHKNPNTRTWYFFPKDARRYVGLVASLIRRTWNAQICESGHDDCALWDRGPCENRVAAEYKTHPDDPMWDNDAIDREEG